MTANTTTTQRSARLSLLLERLKAKGLRLTPQRLAILRALVMHPGHPSVEELHQGLLPEHPTMSLATVYKTITLLKHLDEVLELEFSSRDNRFDGFNPRPHPHLICTGCGRIMDPDIPGLQELVAGLERSSGFAVATHRLDFYGLCPACQSRK